MSSENKSIQLGLCCLNTILRAKKPPIFASRKMIIRTVEEQGIDVLKEKIIQNLISTFFTMLILNFIYGQIPGMKLWRE